MISTVTVSTITVVAASSVAAGAAIFATIFLIGLLAGKTMLGASSGNKHRLLVRSLTIGIVPLLIGFFIIVGLKVAEILA